MFRPKDVVRRYMKRSSIGRPAVVVTLDAPLAVARWRPLVSPIVVLPHLVLGLLLQMAADGVTLFAWASIMTTGRLPRRTAGIQCMAQRVSMRSIAYAACLVETYPTLSFAPQVADPRDFPGLYIDFEPQYEARNRATVGARLVLVLPIALVLAPLVVVSLFVAWTGWIVVLATGRWPERLRRFILDVMRWNLSMQAYMDLLVDEYPHLRFT